MLLYGRPNCDAYDRYQELTFIIGIQLFRIDYINIKHTKTKKAPLKKGKLMLLGGRPGSNRRLLVPQTSALTS